MSSIAYDLRRIKGIALDVDGVLSPTVIPMAEDGTPLRMVNVKDGYALQLAVKQGLKIAIISGGDSPAVAARFKALGVQDVFLSVPLKLPVFEKWMADNDLKPEEVAYMGDDIPDLQVMRKAGLPCAPYDAAAEALATADYVSKFTGGYGCVRDLIEQILKAQGLWMTDKAFHW